MDATLIDRDIQTIEPILEELVQQHGIEAVEAALSPLLTVGNWDAWQRVANAARRIARRVPVPAAS